MATDHKAALYRRLVREASDAAAIERMRVNGFWPWGQGIPRDPPDELKERAQIEAEIAKIQAQSTKSVDPDKALAQERKRRWEESKKRRAAKRLERASLLKKRRDDFIRYRKANVLHLGVGVSAGLQDTRPDTGELTRRGLPSLTNGSDLAMMMGVPLASLRWLCFHRRGAALMHYHRFGIPKKSGGTRSISAPKPRLANAQRWVLQNILERLDTAPPAHGFVRHRSILTNATPHARRAVVMNFDLKDFFPSITFRRVKGLFRKLGYNEHVATILGLLCTEPPRARVEVDGRVIYLALGDRVLPQGACTSPAITNALCKRLDARLLALASRHGFTYTRYADDLTFSGDDGALVGRLRRSVVSVVSSEGFTENTAKTRIMRQGSRQEVTGLTVNDRPTMPRDEFRQLRAMLHNAAKHGLESQNRTQHPAFAQHLAGRVEFACWADPTRAEKLRSALAAALARG
ncbi:MAG: RNA-directed DNA polymerase [Deltaproteobacteria bacterium]|nr:RNA-directed DNA polymerase [Deltaproteobacteria bacterium]